VAVSSTTNVEVEVPSTLSSITVYPPVVYLRPCGTATLEVTGHYEDGVARNLSAQPGLRLAFAAGNAVQSGVNGVQLDQPLDDTVTVTIDGIDSARVQIRVISPDDLELCEGTPTTTTSSTTPAPSTTTSTLPPACQSDADCDDGDACTGDLCAPGGCEHVAAVGLEGAECLLSAALAEALCPAGTIAPKLERFATAKLEHALDLVGKARLATKPKRQSRLIRKASRTLEKTTHHNPGATTDECLQALTARVDAIIGALQGRAAAVVHDRRE
jgi:hypothetical protein